MQCMPQFHCGMRIGVLAVILFLASGIESRSSADPELGISTERVWSDKTGKHKVLADYVKHDNTHVTLKKRDGLAKTVPINILSQSDRDYLSNKENLPTANAIGQATPALIPANIPANAPPLRSKTIRLRPGKWTYKPDAAKPVTHPVLAIDIPHNKNQRITDFVVTPDKRKALITLTDNQQRPTTAIIDLETGKDLGQFLVPKQAKITDVHADGKHVALLKERESPLVATISGRQVARFDLPPNADRFGIMFDQQPPAFVGDDLLITHSKFCWNWKKKELIYTIEDDGPGAIRTAPAFTANRRTFVAGNNYRQGLFLVDSATGAIQGNLPGSGGIGSGRLAFSPDGTKLATAVGYNHIVIWDLAKQGKKTTIPIGSPRRELKELIWCGNNHLLAFGSLVDIQLNATVWRYKLSRKGETQYVPRSLSLVGLGQNRFAGLLRTPEGGHLLPLNIPDKSVVQSIEAAKGDLITLGKGGKIRINAELDAFTPEEQAGITHFITEHFRSSDVTISDDADVELSLSATKKEPEKVVVAEYFRTQNRRDRRSVPEGNNTFQISKSELTIRMHVKGTTIFERKRLSNFEGDPRNKNPNGIVIALQQTETLEQAIDRLNRIDPGFFKMKAIPTSFTVMLGDVDGRQSTITPEGIK